MVVVEVGFFVMMIMIMMGVGLGLGSSTRGVIIFLVMMK